MYGCPTKTLLCYKVDISILPREYHQHDIQFRIYKIIEVYFVKFKLSIYM